jgi:hypothetical protein
MKVSVVAGCVLLFAQQATAFQVAPASKLRVPTSLGMFSGAGAAAPKEDSPEEKAQMEQVANAMGMSLEEYTIAMNARVRLAEKMDNTIIVSGKADVVQVERDMNNPPKKFEVKISEAAKALGKEELSKKLVAAYKKSSEDARVGRANAQKEMMQFIGEQLKK